MSKKLIHLILSIPICSIAIVVLATAGAAQAQGPLTDIFDVYYVCEWEEGDSCVKFEDAIDDPEADEPQEMCLGEDGAVEADSFAVRAIGEVTRIIITWKAGLSGGVLSFDPSTVPVPYDFDFGNICGLSMITLEAVTDDTYFFTVQSDDLESRGQYLSPALSHIKFCFEGDDVEVADPGAENGYCVIEREVIEPPAEDD
jgi:hypothetical protein